MNKTIQKLSLNINLFDELNKICDNLFNNIFYDFDNCFFLFFILI